MNVWDPTPGINDSCEPQKTSPELQKAFKKYEWFPEIITLLSLLLNLLKMPAEIRTMIFLDCVDIDANNRPPPFFIAMRRYPDFRQLYYEAIWFFHQKNRFTLTVDTSPICRKLSDAAINFITKLAVE